MYVQFSSAILTVNNLNISSSIGYIIFPLGSVHYLCRGGQIKGGAKSLTASQGGGVS